MRSVVVVLICCCRAMCGYVWKWWTFPWSISTRRFTAFMADFRRTFCASSLSRWVSLRNEYFRI